MIDFILGVTHPQHWHSLNMRQNPSHYSCVKHFGPNAVAHLQEAYGGRLYYNADVNMKGVRIKYGVVSMHHLLSDLQNWNTFYLAGRMQKRKKSQLITAIKILRDDPRIRMASHINLLNAVRVSLLLLPEKFTEEQLFLIIGGLSYMGDFRMGIFENPHKVNNIVSAQMDSFREKYCNIY
jgi:translocator assembly and maintenance protein 41